MKSYILFLIILLIGVYLRSYRAQELFMYSHDQDLSSWIVRDVVDNKHLRLAGQETSFQGVFIGMFYYYLLIPFYVLTNMDPVGGLYLSIILGGFAVFSCYFVFRKIFNEKIALVASFFYATSFFVVFTEREVVPTMPVILWTLWFLYSIYLIYKGNQKSGFLLIGGLLALIWHLNLGLLIVIPLIFIAFLLSKKPLSFRYLFYGLLVLIIFSLPLIFFELKHNFIQSRAVWASIFAEEKIAVNKLAKLDRVMQLVVKNVSSLYGSYILDIPQKASFYAALVVLLGLMIKNKIEKKFGLILLVWILSYIGFFTLNSINPSEYYLNGMMIVWLLIASVFIGTLLENKVLRVFGLLILIAFILGNAFRFITMNINKSGYLERKALVAQIKSDAEDKAYPCVAVSYITKPGYDLGYRYLFRVMDMHVNQPISGSPVYTIVFPLSMVGRVDKTFGVIGLIYPEYSRYTIEGVEKSCSGENSNLTDPLFGYTE